MKRSILSRGLLLAVILLMGAALYGNGNYIFYMLTYIFIFLFLLFSMVRTASPGKEKFIQAILYALILAAQILFAVLVMRPAAPSGQLFDFYYLLGVLIIFVPFLFYI